MRVSWPRSKKLGSLCLHEWVDPGPELRVIPLPALLLSMSELTLVKRSGLNLYLPCYCPWVSWLCSRGQDQYSTCLVIVHEWVDPGPELRVIPLPALLLSMSELTLFQRSGSSLYLPCCCPWVSWLWSRAQDHYSTCLVVVHEWVDSGQEVRVIPLPALLL